MGTHIGHEDTRYDVVINIRNTREFCLKFAHFNINIHDDYRINFSLVFLFRRATVESWRRGNVFFSYAEADLRYVEHLL